MFALGVGRLARTALPSVSVEVAGLRWHQVRMCSSVGEEKRVFVANLGYGTTEVKLKNHLNKIAEVNSVTILKNRQGGSLGCAVVEMSSPLAANEVKKLVDSFLDGRRINVTDFEERGADRAQGEPGILTDQSRAHGRIQKSTSDREFRELIETPRASNLDEQPSAGEFDAQGSQRDWPRDVLEYRGPDIGSEGNEAARTPTERRQGEAYKVHAAMRTAILRPLTPETTWQSLKDMAVAYFPGRASLVQYAEVIEDDGAIVGRVRFKHRPAALEFVGKTCRKYYLNGKPIDIHMCG